MKKLFLLIFTIMLVVSVNAQHTGKLTSSQSLWNPTIVAADTLHTTAAITFLLDVNRMTPTTQDIYVKLDSITASGISVQMKGKKFTEETAYANIGSAVVWHGTSADTAFTMSNATAARYRYIAVTFTGTGTNAKSGILDVQFKIWNE